MLLATGLTLNYAHSQVPLLQPNIFRSEYEQLGAAGVQALLAVQTPTVGALGDACTLTISNWPKLFYTHSLVFIS